MSNETLLHIAIALAGYAGVGVSAGIAERLMPLAADLATEVAAPDPAESLDSSVATAANMFFQ